MNDPCHNFFVAKILRYGLTSVFCAILRKWEKKGVFLNRESFEHAPQNLQGLKNTHTET